MLETKYGGDTVRNSHGELIEDLLSNSGLCVSNNGQSTHVHKETNSKSCVDITMVSPDIYADLDRQVDVDLYGSDHFSCCVRGRAAERQVRHNIDTS